MGDVGYIETWRNVRVPPLLRASMYIASCFVMYGFQMLVDPAGFEEKEITIGFFIRLFIIVFTWKTMEKIYKLNVFEKDQKKERIRRLGKKDD